MGRIAAPFGVKGWIKIQPFSEDPAALTNYATWCIGRGADCKPYRIEAVQDHGNTLIAKLQGIDDRDAAYVLRGLEISVARSELPATGENEFYWTDLIGLAAINRQGHELGKVTGLLETGAHDVLVVRGEREHLIPFVAAFVGKVDFDAGTIEVDWGEDW